MEVLDRLVLHDVQWGRMSRHVIDDARTRGSSGRDGDLEHLIVDSAIVRARQHAAGAKRGLKVRPLAAHARV